MTQEELKLEILKIVHKPGISPNDNVEYAKKYMEYIQEGAPPDTSVTAAKRAVAKK